jgi:hypothetical protein
MPCPYFEPQRVAAQPAQAAVRLPLIEEYEGLCHAGFVPLPAPADVQFHCCNHGNCAGRCSHFPANALRTSHRFHATRNSPACLEIVHVEELNYTPLAWRPVKYSSGDGLLEPDSSDICVRSQILAFCRSYLKYFEG